MTAMTEQPGETQPADAPTPPPPAGPVPSRSRRPIILGGAGLLVAGLVAVAFLVGHGSSKPKTAALVTVHRTIGITTTGDFSWDIAPNGVVGICHGGSGGFRRHQAGSEVVVTNQAGVTIGIGALDDNGTATFNGCQAMTPPA